LDILNKMNGLKIPVSVVMIVLVLGKISATELKTLVGTQRVIKRYKTAVTMLLAYRP
jgi:hypothetical protein